MCKYLDFFTFYQLIHINDRQSARWYFSPDINLDVCERQELLLNHCGNICTMCCHEGMGECVEHIVPIGNYLFVCAELTPLSLSCCSLPNYCWHPASRKIIFQLFSKVTMTSWRVINNSPWVTACATKILWPRLFTRGVWGQTTRRLYQSLVPPRHKVLCIIVITRSIPE